MAHFARIKNNIVDAIIVGDDDMFTTDKHIWIVGGGDEWIQTSYNTRHGVHLDPITLQPSEDQSKALRKNFAQIGDTYDREKDAFIPKCMWKNWVLNEFKCTYEPPVPYPQGDKYHEWDDVNICWKESTQDKYRK
jgi:hypothetical protein